MKWKTLYLTERGERHQQKALAAAPDVLDVVMLRQPRRHLILTHLVDTSYLISERAGLIDAEIIGAASRLRLIQRIGSLSYDIDLDAAQAAGIPVCIWPIGSAIRVAEHLVMQMLMLLKKALDARRVVLSPNEDWQESRRTDEDTFAYNWSGLTNVVELRHETIGIVGFGEIGAELARRLRGWDCNVLYNKRRRLPNHVEDSLGIQYAEVDELFRRSKILVNLLPYFSETDLWLDKAYLKQMPREAFLVSCGSGSVIHEADLAAAVESGRLAGAALDTFEWEPLPRQSPLVKLACEGYNVLLTPHVAAGASSHFENERSLEYSNVVNHIQGRPLQYRLV